MLIDQYEAQVASRPSSPALKLEDERVFTFGEVNELAKKIQLCLKQQVQQVNDDVGTPLVAVMMTRSVGFIATILAILKTGAAYVPVDPAFPPDRQSYIFSHSKCQLLVADHDSYKSAVELGAELPTYMIVDSYCGEVDFKASFSIRKDEIDWSEVETITRVEPTDQQLAYVLYTSGSTGKPKGVMVKQLGVANIVGWFADEMNVGPGSIVMGLTTFCFDISVLEIFLPLTRGGLLVLADSSTQKDPFRLIDLLTSFKVTVFQATPTTYEMMLATGWTGDPGIDFLVGGEAFRPTLLPLADQAGGRCRSLRNVYGPTETTIWSLSYTVPQSLALTSGSVAVPIGTAISRTLLYIVADKPQPTDPWKQVEFGGEGELWIGGIGVAKGYLHAPALTQEKFFANPFGEGLVYRTGDVVKQLPTPGKEFVFVRRIDDQVKVDGFRIELAEIEAVYMQQADVEQAVALVRNNKLVIYLKLTQVARDDAEINPLLDKLKTAASRSLTYYMVPKYSVIVTAFPQTANGKIDRKALPDPIEFSAPPPTADDPAPEVLSSNAAASVDTVATATPGAGYNQERGMVNHIIEVVKKLRDQRPGPNSSFASLGLDSLGSIMFIRTLSVSLEGMKINPALLYKPGVTIRTLAIVLLQRLEVENPALREKIIGQPVVGDQFIENPLLRNEREGQLGSGAQDVVEEVDSISEVTAAEADFDNALVLNMRLLQGMRGILTWLVLWDHFHEPAPFSTVAYTDTFLFVMMSGFTTALQLRKTPSFEVSSTGELVLKRRKSFNWRMFLWTRAFGLYPILWLALLINTPYWYYQDTDYRGRAYSNHAPGLEQSSSSAACTFLYIIGLQSWDPACQSTGPDNVVYASYIIVCFILYSIIRFFLHRVQDEIMQARSASFILPFSIQSAKSGKSSDIEAQTTTAKDQPATQKEQLANFVTALTYNRASNVITATLVTIGWFVLVSTPFAAITATNPVGVILFVPYFLAGVAAASVIEMWFYVLWKPREMSEDEYQKTIGWKDSVWATANAVRDSVSMGVKQVLSPCSLKLTEVAFFAWRYSPDGLALMSGFLLSSIGTLKHSSLAPFLQFTVLPWILLAYLVIAFLQGDVARNNITRYCFETSLLNYLGYVAYPVYLFQRIVFNWYLPLIVNSIGSNRNEFVRNGYQLNTDWYTSINYGWRFMCVSLLTCFCWLIQKYFQDTLMLWLYTYVSKLECLQKIQK